MTERQEQNKKEAQSALEAVDVPEYVPLKVRQIVKRKLFGPLGQEMVRKIIYDPRNKFTLIQVGGTKEHPYYGVTTADIKRYWQEKAAVGKILHEKTVAFGGKNRIKKGSGKIVSRTLNKK